MHTSLNKPANVDVARNKRAVWTRGDTLLTCLPLTEGSGTALANLGSRTASPWDAPQLAVESWSTSRGGAALLDGLGGGVIAIANTAIAESIAAGSIKITFQLTTTGGTRGLYKGGAATADNDTIHAVFTDTTLEVRHQTTASNDNAPKYTFTLTTGVAYTLHIVWGTGGFYAYINGTLGSAANNPAADTVAHAFGAGPGIARKAMIGQTNSAGEYVQGLVWVVKWFDCELTAGEIAEQVADPFIFIRPAAPATLLAGGWAADSAPDETGATVQVAAASTISTDGCVRLLTAEDAIMASPTAGDAVLIEHGADDAAAVQLHADIAAGGTLYALVQYATTTTPTDADWQVLPQGRLTLRSAQEAGWSGTIGIIGDQHICETANRGNIADICAGVDLDALGAGNPRDQLKYNWRIAQATTAAGVELVIQTGDYVVPSYAADDAARLLFAQYYLKATSDLRSRVAVLHAQGNHEAEQTWRDTGIPATNRAMRRRFLVNQDAVDAGAYYARAWGDCLFLVLDPHTNTTISHTDDLDAPNFEFGATQKAWAVAQLAASSHAHKFIVLHNLAGQYHGTFKWYGWGPGTAQARHRAATWPAGTYDDNGGGAATQCLTDFDWLHQTAQAYAMTAVLFDHAHQWCHARVETVNYVCVGNASATAVMSAGTGFTDVVSEILHYTSGSTRGFTRLNVTPTAVTLKFYSVALGASTVTELYSVQLQNAEPAGDPVESDTLAANAAGGRFWIDTDGTVLALDSRAVYLLRNIGNDVLLGSTDGTAVEADAVSAAGQFTLPADDDARGVGLRISGVSALAVQAENDLTQLLITRLGFARRRR